MLILGRLYVNVSIVHLGKNTFFCCELLCRIMSVSGSKWCLFNPVGPFKCWSKPHCIYYSTFGLRRVYVWVIHHGRQHRMQIFNRLNHCCHSCVRLHESSACVRMVVEIGPSNLLLSDVILKTCQSKVPGYNDPVSVCVCVCHFLFIKNWVRKQN